MLPAASMRMAEGRSDSVCEVPPRQSARARLSRLSEGAAIFPSNSEASKLPSSNNNTSSSGSSSIPTTEVLPFSLPVVVAGSSGDGGASGGHNPPIGFIEDSAEENTAAYRYGPLLIGLLSLHVVAVPSLAALAVVRFDHPEARFVSATATNKLSYSGTSTKNSDEQACNNFFSRSPFRTDKTPPPPRRWFVCWWWQWAQPQGVWIPASSTRAFCGIRGALVNHRGRLLFAVRCCLLLLICALVGAPTRSRTCAAQHVSAGVIVLMAAAVAVAVVRPFSAPLSTVLTVLGGVTLGVFLLLQGVAPQAYAAKAILLVLNVACGFLRSGHACVVRCYYLYSFSVSSSSSSVTPAAAAAAATRDGSVDEKRDQRIELEGLLSIGRDHIDEDDLQLEMKIIE